MRSSRLPSAMLLSLLIAILLWVAGPIAADGQRQPAKKKAPAPAARAKPVAVPSVRTLRAERFARLAPGGAQQEEIASRSTAVRGQDDQSGAEPRVPREQRLRRATTFDGDLRALPRNIQRREREEREGPEPSPTSARSRRGAARRAGRSAERPRHRHAAGRRAGSLDHLRRPRLQQLRLGTSARHGRRRRPRVLHPVDQLRRSASSPRRPACARPRSR